jgi:hypothetical protein
MTTKSENDTREFVREHELRVGNLSTPIRMLVYRRKADGKLLLEQSHFVKTSIQYLPYVVTELDGNDEAAAVKALQQVFIDFYDQAVRRGYVASESWVVPNANFQET